MESLLIQIADQGQVDEGVKPQQFAAQNQPVLPRHPMVDKGQIRAPA